MSKQCKCEHWEQCPTCMPHRFGSDGEMLPIPLTPLQTAQARIAELEKENATLAAQNVAMRESFIAIDAEFGNSKPSKVRMAEIARKALYIPPIASEVLKRRDAEVREQCAKVCGQLGIDKFWQTFTSGCNNCAEAIRALNTEGGK